MIITSNTNAVRLQRTFPRLTLISIQNRGANPIFIGKDQGEVQSAAGGSADGLELTAGNTFTPPAQPFTIMWKGELWHASTVAGSQWALVTIGEVNEKDASTSQHPQPPQKG